MIFIYAFYIDVFIFQNFLMNLIVLSLTKVFCKSFAKLCHLRMALGALASAWILALLLLLLPSYAAAMMTMAGVLVPFMIWFSFGWNGWRQFLQRIGVSWLSIVLLNGVTLAVYNLTGIRSFYCYICVLVLLLTRFLLKITVHAVKKRPYLFHVTLEYHGKSVSCTGFYDSGNLLTMPGSGEPVHIISPDILKPLIHEDGIEEREISYHALGTKEGKIRVFHLDRLLLENPQSGPDREILSPYVGKAQEGLLKGKEYQIILNSAVF